MGDFRADASLGNGEVMGDHYAALEVKRPSMPAVVQRESHAGDVSSAILGMAEEPDVTAIISGEGSPGDQIMIAISNGNFFVSLVCDSGAIYQYIAEGKEHIRGEDEFIISGSRTNIESRYVVDGATAAAVVREWLDSDCLQGALERFERMLVPGDR